MLVVESALKKVEKIEVTNHLTPLAALNAAKILSAAGELFGVRDQRVIPRGLDHLMQSVAVTSNPFRAGGISELKAHSVPEGFPIMRALPDFRDERSATATR
jgi:hypothetical protein